MAGGNRIGDEELNRLQAQLVQNSPDLQAALARYQQAKAFADQLRSGLFPSLGLRADGARARQSETNPPAGQSSPRYYNSYGAGVEATYEVDLWGRVRNDVNAGRLEASAAAADLESARLSLQAQLADYYIAIYGLDREAALLADTVAAYRPCRGAYQGTSRGRHRVRPGCRASPNSAGYGAIAERRKTRRNARRWNTRSLFLWANRLRNSLWRRVQSLCSYRDPARCADQSVATSARYRRGPAPYGRR